MANTCSFNTWSGPVSDGTVITDLISSDLNINGLYIRAVTIQGDEQIKLDFYATDNAASVSSATLMGIGPYLLTIANGSEGMGMLGFKKMVARGSAELLINCWYDGNLVI